ncbi:MAG: RhuM family protein [Aeromonas sp.]
MSEYLIKGCVMDDGRLKNPPVGSAVVPDYFDELLERIRDIRASDVLIAMCATLPPKMSGRWQTYLWPSLPWPAVPRALLWLVR